MRHMRTRFPAIVGIVSLLAAAAAGAARGAAPVEAEVQGL